MKKDFENVWDTCFDYPCDMNHESEANEQIN